PTLVSSRPSTVIELMNGTPEAARSTQARAANAYKNVAMKTPRACAINGSPASHNESRGEYAVALNWIITNVRENTMAVSAIIPEAMEVYIAMAAGTLMSEMRCGAKASTCGSNRPAMMAQTA